MNPGKVLSKMLCIYLLVCELWLWLVNIFHWPIIFWWQRELFDSNSGNKSEGQWPEHHNIYISRERDENNIWIFITAPPPAQTYCLIVNNECLIVAIIPEMIGNGSGAFLRMPSWPMTSPRCQEDGRCYRMLHHLRPHTSSQDNLFWLRDLLCALCTLYCTMVDVKEVYQSSIWGSS